MKTSSFFRRATLAILPAALLLSACGKDDVTAPAAPDQGRIITYHAAASANVPVKVLYGESDKGTYNYGQSTGYQALNTGSQLLRVNVASSGAAATSQTVTVEKDKSYSYFAYANSTTSVAGLFVSDELTTPSTVSGVQQAKIRLVHLGQGTATPLKISSTSVAGLVDVANINVPFGSASPFVEIPPGTYNLAVTTGTPSLAVANVGDGSGSGTGTKAYEAGKIYTVILRGITGALVDPTLAPKAVLVQNN